MPDAAILSISSQVAFGHVGNRAIEPALQALGFEVWAVPTVLLAHHPGHGPPAGLGFPAGQLAGLIEGIDRVGALAGVAGVISGYLGTAEAAEVIADAVRRVRLKRPEAPYLCDPILGDAGRLYVRPGVEEAIGGRLLPLASVVTPNHFELERLSGAAVATLAQAVAAARGLLARGPRLVVVTSLQRGDGAPGTIETLAVSAAGAWLAAVPRLERLPQGSGDLLAALLLGHLVHGAAPPNALARAVSAVDVVLRASEAAPEMRLVASLAKLRSPPPLAVQRVG